MENQIPEGSQTVTEFATKYEIEKYTICKNATMFDWLPVSGMGRTKRLLLNTDKNHKTAVYLKKIGGKPGPRPPLNLE